MTASVGPNAAAPLDEVANAGEVKQFRDRRVGVDDHEVATEATSGQHGPAQLADQLEVDQLPHTPTTRWHQGCSPSMLTIQDTPKRSWHDPNSGDQNVSPSGIWISPPSANASKIRRASS